MKTVDWNFEAPCGAQGDVIIVRLTEDEAANLNTSIEVRSNNSGELKLLEGELTGHFHMIEPALYRDDSMARSLEAGLKQKIGKAVLYEDAGLAESLPWLIRTDLIVGFLKVNESPVIVVHPEHDGIRLPEGTYYIGRQIEQAGEVERLIID